MLGINERNLHYIYTHNSRRDFQIADDKTVTKGVLDAIGVPHPATYAVYGYFYELGNLGEELGPYTDFVIKPVHGRGGGGIVVVTGRDGGGWSAAGGRVYTQEGLKRHISDIIFGVYSFDLHDQAMVEARVEQHPEMADMSRLGLADIRVVFFKNEPVLTMTRIPTYASEGKANIHQGAVGVGIDMATGRTIHAVYRDRVVTRHPDTGVGLLGRRIPFWDRVIEVGRRVARAVPLKYLGIDVAIGADDVMVLEINVRPGLQIQDVNRKGMRTILDGLGRGPGGPGEAGP
ncbi:MAG: sugar-transfer associated ATP-grasp domain-containing protein [Thermodesulfobacteriota bacterium]